MIRSLLAQGSGLSFVCPALPYTSSRIGLPRNHVIHTSVYPIQWLFAVESWLEGCQEGLQVLGSALRLPTPPTPCAPAYRRCMHLLRRNMISSMY